MLAFAGRHGPRLLFFGVVIGFFFPALAAKLTDAADRERLIQAVPTFRAIVVAHRRMRGEPAATP